MFVRVSNGSVNVYEADDCTSLEVRVDEAESSAALSAAGLGDWAGTSEMDLNVAALHALARAAATLPDWEERWTAMLAYAERHDWLGPNGDTVRAHIVNY